MSVENPPTSPLANAVGRWFEDLDDRGVFITDDRLIVRPAPELLAIFTKAGVRPGDTIIGYCHIGQQATAMLFAARTLGHPVLLYDGSFEDWSRHADYPVEAAAAK